VIAGLVENRGQPGPGLEALRQVDIDGDADAVAHLQISRFACPIQIGGLGGPQGLVHPGPAVAGPAAPSASGQEESEEEDEDEVSVDDAPHGVRSPSADHRPLIVTMRRPGLA
jgi:hypothetical protein